MKYTMRRKINIGKYGPQFQYESIDLEVTDAATKEEAQQEIIEWKAAIELVIENRKRAANGEPPKEIINEEELPF